MLKSQNPPNPDVEAHTSTSGALGLAVSPRPIPGNIKLSERDGGAICLASILVGLSLQMEGF